MDKQERYIRAVGGNCWYAACEDGHPFWAGDDRDIYKKADDDAKDHDKKKHNDGNDHAVVLSCD